MSCKLLSAAAALSLVLPGLAAAAETESGALPATEHQVEALKDAPEEATTRDPEARGMTTEGGLPVSPHQAQVTEEVTLRFGYLDTDKDGHISADEAKVDPDLQSRWNQLDSDSDNQLNRTEFSAFEPKTD